MEWNHLNIASVNSRAILFIFFIYEFSFLGKTTSVMGLAEK